MKYYYPGLIIVNGGFALALDSIFNAVMCAGLGIAAVFYANNNRTA